jgi:hypothetical protein
MRQTFPANVKSSCLQDLVSRIKLFQVSSFNSNDFKRVGTCFDKNPPETNRELSTGLFPDPHVVNEEGYLDFEAEFPDSDSHPKSEDEGKSYKQALCAAYDLALAKVMLPRNFLRFLYHDGLLEGMDDRTKLNMIDVLREFAGLGIQQIPTVIDSDLSLTTNGERFAFEDHEVVRVLHDDGPSGRLFNMGIW